MALYHTFMVSIPLLYLLITPLHLCFAAASKKATTGLSLKLIHRDSPESPLYPGNLTSSERMARYAKWSGVRASYLGSIASKNATSMVDNPDSIMRPPVFADGLHYYMVSIGIGTPKQDAFLLLDTAADLSWTQCLPCINCYVQDTPIYNSTISSTFNTIGCNHPLCRNVLKCTPNDLCSYNMAYGDSGGQSHTSGFAMTETLTFMTDDQDLMRVDNIVLGCSKDSRDFVYDESIGGIMGLNTSPHSLASQLGDMIERKFSYCLTPDDPDQSFSAYLRFGGDIVVRGTVQKTPFVRLGDHYGLNLKDISIADVPIGYPDGTFAPKQGGAGGCFIDSGAPVTTIERQAFNTFIAAFENFFQPNNPLVRNTRNCPNSNTYCYYSQGVKQYPSITLHFEGADYIIPTENLIWPITDTYFMLTITPSDITILGAWQQHNVRIVYDLHEGYLSFVPEVCSDDT